MGDELSDGHGNVEVATPRRRFSFPRMTLALSAFIMSLTITLISAYHGLQGAEMLVRAPDKVILYRDGTHLLRRQNYRAPVGTLSLAGSQMKILFHFPDSGRRSLARPARNRLWSPSILSASRA